MQTAVATTDHAARHPQEDIEMLKAQHLTNALKFIGNAMHKPLAPSIKRGPQKHSPIAGHNALATELTTPSAPSTEPRVVPMNSLGNIDDPHDLPAGDITAPEDAIDSRSAPLVSLGQGEYQTDYTPADASPALQRLRSIALNRTPEAMSAVYIQCSKMARLPQDVLNVTDIQATMSLRVVGTINPARCADLTDPAEPATFRCHKVYLGRALHEQILMDFAKKLHARGVEPGRVLFMVETLNAALSPVHMDAIDDEELASISDAALAARGLPNR